MSSASTIDFELLLRPIPGESASGVDLRTLDSDSHQSPYRQIQSDVIDSRGIERDHFFKDPANPDFALSNCKWPEIVAQAEKVLAEQSKDLEIAAWLCDGLLRVYGFAGLRDGLRLARQLVENYWDSLYPALDGSDDGIRARLKQFDSVLQARRNPCYRAPITAREKLSEYDYELAQQLEKIGDPKEKQLRIENGEVSMKRFNESCRESGADFWRNLEEDLLACLSEGEQLSLALKGVCTGTDALGMERAPSFREFTEVLNKVLAIVRLPDVGGSHLGKEAVASAPGAGGAAAGEGQAAGTAGVAMNGQAATRDAALIQLRELANFFRRTEPHSPISHHLEQAIRWGQMALPELLTELVPDEGARNDLFTRIGIAVANQQ